MPTTPDFTNEKPAARTNRDGLRFVSTTTRLTPGKANRHGYVHPDAAQFKPF